MALAVLLLAGATLWPQPGNAIFEQSNPACPLCSGVSVADVVANLLLFFPFGFCVALWRKSGRAFGSDVTPIVLLALVLSTSIEVIQYFGIVNGRHASVFDVVCNVTGAALGSLIAGALPWVARASVEASRWLFSARVTQ